MIELFIKTTVINKILDLIFDPIINTINPQIKISVDPNNVYTYIEFDVTNEFTLHDTDVEGIPYLCAKMKFINASIEILEDSEGFTYEVKYDKMIITTDFEDENYAFEYYERKISYYPQDDAWLLRKSGNTIYEHVNFGGKYTIEANLMSGLGTKI